MQQMETIWVPLMPSKILEEIKKLLDEQLDKDAAEIKRRFLEMLKKKPNGRP